MANNFYVHTLDRENLIAILSPTSAVPLVVENYAPVHLLLHAAEWQVFGPSVRGYHVVNVVVHALAACLLVVAFRRTGIGATASALAGAFFLVHPANVEAVAWISQLKTSAAMVLGLAAFLLGRSRPALAAALFGLALMAKPTAAVVLFFALALAWSRPAGDGEGLAPAPRWLAVWGGLFVAFAIAETAAFAQTAGSHVEADAAPVARLLGTLAIALRYLVMAATSIGVSTFHDPPAGSSLGDPWVLGALVVLAATGHRLFATLRGRRVEAAWWIWALVSWAPIAGLIPLPFPMADRYLYFILPGLLGALLLGAPDARARLAERVPALASPRIAIAAAAVAVAWIGVFGVRAHQRAYVWQSEESVAADAARNYPEGRMATLRRALEASSRGDAVVAVRLLEEAHARGWDRLRDLQADPAFAPIRAHPDFVALKHAWARERIERYGDAAASNQPQLMMVAQAHIVLEEFDAAERVIYRAIYAGGPMTDYLYRALDELERQRRLVAERAP